MILSVLRQEMKRISLRYFILGFLLTVIAVPFFLNYMVERGKRKLISHLETAIIAETDFRGTPLVEAMQEIHSKVRLTDPYFETCKFHFDDCYSDYVNDNQFARIHLALSDASALTNLKYTAALAQSRCIFRPNEIIIGPLHCEHDSRSFSEKLTHPIINLLTPNSDSTDEPTESAVVKYVRNKLENTILPSVGFVDTPLSDALTFLFERQLELDPESDPSNRGVSFTVGPPYSKTPSSYRQKELYGSDTATSRTNQHGQILITYKGAYDISVLDALEHVLYATGMSMRITEEGRVEISKP